MWLVASTAVPVPLLAAELPGAADPAGGPRATAPSVAVSAPVNPDAYICGVGDVFLVQVWGQADAEYLVTVAPEGDLYIPTIGKVSGVAGRTLREAKRRIRGAVGGQFHDLGFDVTLARPRSFIVNAAGFVARPGSYTMSALHRVSDLVAAAGGASPFGSRRFAEVWRGGMQFATVDFFRLERLGEVEQNVYLLDGDVIKVPSVRKGVAIHGAVRVPGRYELAEDENLQALVTSLCEGWSDDLSTRDPIEIVRRRDSDQYGIVRVSAGQLATADVELFDDDRVFVPTMDRYQKVVRVQGAVVGEGALSVSSGSTAMSNAGAPTTPGAPPSSAPSGEAGVAGSSALIQEFYGVYPFVQGETVSSMVSRAGGVTPWADTDNVFIRRPKSGASNDYDTIPVDLTAILIEKDYDADVELRAGDVLIVPTIDHTVFVTGEVQRPGPITYAPYYTVRYYLGLAGGETTRAALGRSKVIHKDGTKESLETETIVRPGDTIRVEEKTFKFWQDHWTILTGAASLVLAGYAVIYVTQENN